LLLISDEPRWLENELRRMARGADVTWRVLGGLALLSADADAVVVATDDLAHPRLLALFRSLHDGLGVRRCLLLNLGHTRDLRPLLEAPPAHVLHLPDEVAELPAALRALVSALVFDDLTSWLAPNLAPSLDYALTEVLLRSGHPHGRPPSRTERELAKLKRVGRANLSHQATALDADLPRLLRATRVRWILARALVTGRGAEEIAGELGYASPEPLRRLLMRTVRLTLSRVGHTDPSVVEPEIRAALGRALRGA
jgi:hypothetical protein